MIDIRLVDGADGLMTEVGNDADTDYGALTSQFEAASVLKVGKPSPAVLA